MKQRLFFAGLLTVVCVLTAFAQNRKSNLAILPFTGGQENEGETIAELFSFDRQLMDRFGIIPRTSIIRAVEQEQNFQMSSGMTDADTISKIGEQLGAQYVMAGSITSLGGQKLLVVAIIEIETVRQVAGDYLTYTSEEELAGKVPAVVRNLLPMLDVDTSEMEKLAVLPVQLGRGASARDADTLGQILSIALMRNKSYAIYPRTAPLEQVQQEFETQLSGVTDDRQAAQLGKAENPKLVLSVAARKLGSSDRFNASIIDLEDGIQIQGTSEEYANMSDGITAMDIIARILSGQNVSAREQERRAAAINTAAAREEAARKRAAAREEAARKRAAAREEAARKRAQARDRFNKNAGLAVDLQYGGGANSNIESDSTAYLAFLLGLQYSWFSINSGAAVSFGSSGSSRIEYGFLQVPLLLRGDWGEIFNFNIFAGPAYNIPLTATATFAATIYAPATTQSVELTLSPSFIFGTGLGLNMGNFLFYADLQGILDVTETEAKLEDGSTVSFNRAFQWGFALGIRYRLPFTRGTRQ
jgi:TolB-like protein